MGENYFRYEGRDGTPLAGRQWWPAGPPRAVIQLAHGAGEHGGRYAEPLAPLVAAGFAIVAADHRGHGLTSGIGGLGDFGPGGAAAAVDDMAVLSGRLRAEHPGVPLILFGHSMGAMFAQAYLLDHADLIDALVLSGTAAPGKRLEGDWNAGLNDRGTPYDWLSRDHAEVDRYIADPFCGIRFTPESAQTFAELRARPSDAESLAGVPKGLPVYVVVGDADPINARLSRLTPLIKAYEAAGLDVTLKVWPEGRHEMLNETNRDDVVADLLGWLEARAPLRG